MSGKLFVLAAVVLLVIAVAATAFTGIANQLPVADANGPYVGYEGSPITFNGSGSYDEFDREKHAVKELLKIFDEYRTSPTSFCLQDQYGNQYNFEVDSAHKYVYGYVIAAQECDAKVWYLTGSYVGKNLELTAANPLGDNDTKCVPTFKIKGRFPNAAWYYVDGYGDQEFQWSPCTQTKSNAELGGLIRVSANSPLSQPL